MAEPALVGEWSGVTLRGRHGPMPIRFRLWSGMLGNVNPIPRLDNVGRQRVLDAVVELQGRRRAAVTALGEGSGARDARVVASGGDLASWTMRECRSWRRLLSTRSMATGKALSRSMPNNRFCLENGLQMVSVFDYESTDSTARSLLEGETAGPYFYAYAPIQMRIIDEREVLMHGPCDDRGGSILSLTSTGALEAAWTYWHAVQTTAAPCTGVGDEVTFTARQRRALELLSTGLTDEHIAKVLDVSVRTVRADVAQIMELLNVRSRFATGYAYALLKRDRARA